MDSNSPPRPDRGFQLEKIAETLRAHRPGTEPSAKATRRAAVAMILSKGESGALETLFIKRAEHPQDPWSGHMAFPGGHQDPEDSTLEDAARRETAEEVGLALEPGMRIGRLDDIGGGRLRSVHMSVSPFVFFHPAPTPLRLNSEIDDVVWVPLTFLADPGNVKPYPYPLDPKRRLFPSFQPSPDYIIWGMTFRMVGSFLSLFGVELPGEPEMTDVE